VYLNVAGGLRISEPAADLAAASALISALGGQTLPAEAVFFGEVSLSGGIRPVGQAEARLKEAEKLGFSVAFAPSLMNTPDKSGIAIRRIADLTALTGLLTGPGQD
jgi:DNA repair protein RadA/Sms